jgi:integrase
MSLSGKKSSPLELFKAKAQSRNIKTKDLQDFVEAARRKQDDISALKQLKRAGQYIDAKDLKNEYVTRICIGDKLYFRLTPQLKPTFEKRYTYNGKRKYMTLGDFGKGSLGYMTLSDAKDEVAINRSNVKKGIDPLEEKKRVYETRHLTFDDVAVQWLKKCEKNVKNPHIQRRVYEKDIKKEIGGLAVERINALDILRVVERIHDSGRPTIANDALSYCKQILGYAVKTLKKIPFNPALQLSYKDAGGREKARERILDEKEVTVVLKVLRENQDTFTRENYIAFCLLLSLGVRKGELIAAKWKSFDFEKNEWILLRSQTKTEHEVAIPIPHKLSPFFEELKYRSMGSEYLFPNRRASKRRGYISDDTLNHALAKLFGDERYAGKRNKELSNKMAEVNIEHFVVHDLRRSFRTLLSSIGVPNYIAERCLNHKPKGIEKTYDRYTYYEERKDAIKKLVDVLYPLMQPDCD